MHVLNPEAGSARLDQEAANTLVGSSPHHGDVGDRNRS